MAITVQDPDLTIHVGDVRDVLPTLPAESVDCVACSPPYWGLRDYGANGQLGLETTPDEYVANMVAVFREARRVLRPAGTLWLNLGDSYAAGKAGRADGERRDVDGFTGGRKFEDEGVGFTQRNAPPGFKPKDLVGIPWRLAFALQADGWYLRSDIIWSKPNPMPESVTDRPTKAHEYVFLLSKSPRYWFDAEAVREPATYAGKVVTLGEKSLSRGQATGMNVPASGNGLADSVTVGAGRNVRSVWEITTQPYAGAHFATWPEALAERILKAGCPEWVCGTCGKARERITNIEQVPDKGGGTVSDRQFAADPRDSGRVRGWGDQRTRKEVTTLGWSDCGHENYKPGVCLDPFGGSGTTALVARRLGRRSVLVELNEEYARLAAERCQQLSLLA